MAKRVEPSIPTVRSSKSGPVVGVEGVRDQMRQQPAGRRFGCLGHAAALQGETEVASRQDLFLTQRPAQESAQERQRPSPPLLVVHEVDEVCRSSQQRVGGGARSVLLESVGQRVRGEDPSVGHPAPGSYLRRLADGQDFRSVRANRPRRRRFRAARHGRPRRPSRELALAGCADRCASREWA